MSLTSEQMEQILGGAGKRKGSMDIDPMKWKDANPNSFKQHDLSQIPKLQVADSLVAEEYGGNKKRQCKSLSKSGGMSSSSSVPSVAEERDTISLCASTNANILTPSNISRVM